jgi:hypothetical protein
MQRRSILLFAAAAILLLTSACSFPHYKHYDPGVAIPPAHAIVIAKIKFTPKIVRKFEGNFKQIGANLPKEGEIAMFTNPNIKKPLRKSVVNPIPLAGTKQINIGYEYFTYHIMPVGTHYLRYGMLTYGSYGCGTSGSVGTGTRGHTCSRELRVFGDVKFEVPKGAKAVYIGTLAYKHDGQMSSRVTVKDEFSKLKKSLRKVKGIRTRDVKKRLGKVIRQY